METDALNQRDRAANDDEPLNPGKLQLLYIAITVHMYIELLMRKKPDNDDLLKIFEYFEDKYKVVGTGLGVKVTDLQYDPDNSETTLITVFNRWKTENNEVTWGKIAEVCDSFKVQLGGVKSNLLEYLSSRDAHDKYLDKKDWTK